MKTNSPKQATPFLRLPFNFDTTLLQQDLAAVRQQHWIAHYNNQAHEKDWLCLPLRSAGGNAQHILAVADQFLDTTFLQLCPYFQFILNSFACEKTSVRLMALAAGGKILPHSDPGGGYEDGVARLHIPIQTSPLVTFTIDDKELHFAAGTCWYMNANCQHSVNNASALERIHLVIDCVPNAWLDETFIAAGWKKNPDNVYGETNINAENVTQIIAQLKANNHPTSLALADKLAQIHAATSNSMR